MPPPKKKAMTTFWLGIFKYFQSKMTPTSPTCLHVSKNIWQIIRPPPLKSNDDNMSWYL